MAVTIVLLYTIFLKVVVLKSVLCVLPVYYPWPTFFVKPNKGNEASCYLQFLSDNYNRLPKRIAFFHGSEFSWHHVGSLLDRINYLAEGDLDMISAYESMNSNDLFSMKDNPENYLPYFPMFWKVVNSGQIFPLSPPNAI